MTGLARDRKSIGSSIDGVSQLVGSTSELLRDVREPAVASIDEFVTVADMVARTRKELNAAIGRSARSSRASAGPAPTRTRSTSTPAPSSLVVGKLLEVNPAGDNGPWSQVCR